MVRRSNEPFDWLKVESLIVPKVLKLPSFFSEPIHGASVALQPIPNLALPSAVGAKHVYSVAFVPVRALQFTFLV